jgi:hypothetical protein
MKRLGGRTLAKSNKPTHGSAYRAIADNKRSGRVGLFVTHLGH